MTASHDNQRRTSRARRNRFGKELLPLVLFEILAYVLLASAAFVTASYVLGGVAISRLIVFARRIWSPL